MSVRRARAAYTARAAEYIDLFGSIEAAAALDRDRVLAWARGIDGRIIDVGCGPGREPGRSAGLVLPDPHRPG
jgi:hypothetical protein